MEEIGASMVMVDAVVEQVRVLMERGDLRGEDHMLASDGLQMLVGKVDTAISLLYEKRSETLESWYRGHIEAADRLAQLQKKDH